MANTEASVSNLKINRLTQTQLENASSLSNSELYMVDPEFTGGKLLATDTNGDIVESDVIPTNIGTVKSVNNTSPDSNGNVTLSIPSEVTETTVSNWGFTKNTGTVTSVNNVSPVSGNVTLSIPTQASDIGAVATTDCYQIYPVIETYVSGTSWYRIYSDGWCEQGGQVDVTENAGYHTINLVKTYANANYSIQLSVGLTDYNREICFYKPSLTASSFEIYFGPNVSDNHTGIWETSGYLASGQYTGGTYKAYKP